jgi:hypothetical protein
VLCGHLDILRLVLQANSQDPVCPSRRGVLDDDVTARDHGGVVSREFMDRARVAVLVEEPAGSRFLLPADGLEHMR